MYKRQGGGGFGFGGFDLEVEQEADDLLLERLEHAVEHVEALALVLDQRVALGHGAQADALLEVVHLVEVLAPLAVQDRQQDAAFQLAHGAGADAGVDVGFAGLVGGEGIGLQGLLEGLAGDVVFLVGVLLPVELDRVQRLEGRPELLEVPVLGVAVRGGAVDVLLDHAGDHVLDLLAQVLAVQDAVALGVDHLALEVHDLVVLEDVLADLEVLLLDLGLRAADGPGDHLVLDRDLVRHLQPGHDGLDHGGVEAPHQLVLQRQVEPGLTGVALAAGTAAQLVVDAAGLVALGAEHVQATGLADLVGLGLDLGGDLLDQLRPGGLVLVGGLDRVEAAFAELVVGDDVGVAAEHDVRAATGHVGGDGDGALAARPGDDQGLAVVVLRVQHLVRDAPAHQQLRQVLGALDARRADQDRLALLVPLGDVVGDRLELRLLGLVDEVGLVLALHRAVRRDRHHAELVGLVELGRLGLGGTGHAAQLLVQAEVVLQGDRGEGLVLRLDLHALLGLDGLVHALVVPTTRQHAAGELVDDHDLTVADDVVLVLGEELLGLQRVVQVADQRRVRGLVEVLDAELVLDEGDADLGDADGALALVDLVVDVLLQQRREPGELLVPARGLVGRAGDDQRGARLVDEDRVDLVDQAEVVAALHALVQAPRHVVAQVVEAELVVRAVGDVGVVGHPALFRRQLGQDHADRQTEEAVDAAHPLRVALGQVVVRGDHVHALARQGVEVRRQHRGQGLALTGAHLGDLAEVQRRATHELHVEGPLAQRALGTLADDGERLGEQLVEGLALGVPLAELDGLLPEFRVREVDDFVFQVVDVRCDVAQALEHLALASAEQSGQHHPGRPHYVIATRPIWAPSTRLDKPALVDIVGKSETCVHRHRQEPLRNPP